MAASTTVKVATITGAAKDDVFASASTGLTEDKLSASLNVLANDPGAAKLYSLTQTVAAAGTQFAVVTTATTTLGATISINADGTIAYNASALGAGLQSLAANESVTDSFTYTVRMANGALSTAKVSVTVGGANDAPTLASVTPLAILDTAADDSPAAITGVLAGHDVDHNAVMSYAATGSSDAGTLMLDSATGAYSFAANADLIDALNAGESATASYSVSVTDEFGASAATTLSFTLVGANDTATISGGASGNVAEDGVLSANGTLAVSDRDAGQSVFAAAANLAGTYGDFSFDAATGAWGYTLRNGDANVQALHNNETVHDTLVVASLDGTASQTIDISIAGANEAVVPAPVVNPVTRFMVTHGTNDVNERNLFTGFDSNDKVVYAANMNLVSYGAVDTNNDGVADATSLHFTFKNASIDVILVGYTAFTADQVTVA